MGKMDFQPAHTSQVVSDETLVLRAQKGDEKALETLIRRYSNYAVSVAYNFVGDLNTARDMAQEALLKMYRKINHLQEPKRFKTWFFAVVRSTCIDELRKNRVKRLSVENLANEDNETPEVFVTQGASVEKDEMREKIMVTISQLPRIYQQIVLLKHLRKMSYKEIADLLGISTATVESRLYRARMMLKEKLEGLYMRGT